MKLIGEKSKKKVKNKEDNKIWRNMRRTGTNVRRMYVWPKRTELETCGVHELYAPHPRIHQFTELETCGAPGVYAPHVCARAEGLGPVPFWALVYLLL